MKPCLLLLSLALTGCHASVGSQWGMPPGSVAPTASVDVRIAGEASSALGAILIGVVVAEGIRYYWRLPDGTRRPYYGMPEPDPFRQINLQDCGQPVDVTAGNLMCR